jgi:two-component system chemotaxis sensor kinase CheA
MSLDAALETFYVEAQEHLESMEDMLLLIDEGDYDHEALNDIFRSAHTIKGSSGIFGLDHIVSFTHVVENILDRARDRRDHEFTLEKNLIDILFRCRDHMEVLVGLSFEDFQGDMASQQTGEALLNELAPWIKSGGPGSKQENSQPVEAQTEEQVSSNVDDGKCWHISLRLAQDCLRNGMDPLSFIRFLSTLGEIKYIESMTDNFVDLAVFDPESLYFTYEIALDSKADKEAIENAFMFVQEDSQITILPPNSSVNEYLQLIESLPEDNQRLTEVFIKCGTLTEDALNKAKQGADKSSSGQSAETKSSEQSKKTDNPPKASNQIRVDSDRLDHLINLIGELVINQQRIDILANQIANPVLIEAVNDFESFSEQIRDASLGLRMVPIGGTLQRFKRLVRDTAKELNKEIKLVIEGEETELDRLMVEKLTDPLTHIVRNAMDHGLETVKQRHVVGKPDEGTLKISAHHDAGHIVIEISDDGRGIKKDVVREKAIAKGIISTETVLSDNELFHLLFHPGFSTAEAVTNLSGRGVGMDVVKRNIESLQGNIDISSETGKGSTFTIRLPLTLAIIEGFHVECCGSHFIIPQAMIIECIDLASHEEIEGQNCINLRGDMVPYLCLDEIFNLNINTEYPLQNTATENKRRSELIIVQFGNELSGIAVDKLNGEIQTVIKPLGPIFKPLKGIGGTSLLGSGEIAFILDIPQLLSLAINSEVNSIASSNTINGGEMSNL